MQELTVDARSLGNACEHLLRAAGSSVAEARIVADHLVGANLRGHDSHGVGMVPTYLRHLRNGTLKPDATLHWLRDDGAFLLADGQDGWGQRIASEAVAHAIRRTHTIGLVTLGIRGSHHMGRIGTYAEQCAEAGLVSFFLVNVVDRSPTAAPHGGSDARLNTNPVTMGVPASPGRAPVILDFATTTIAGGKCRVAMNRQEAVAPGQLLDHRGQPTTDPGVIFRDPTGCLLPMAGHKGFGLAVMAELLAGALSGGGTVHPARQTRGGLTNNLFGFLLDPARLGDLPLMHTEMNAILEYVKASPPQHPDEPVRVAGEPESETMALRLRHGIPLDAATWKQLVDEGSALGVDIAAQIKSHGGQTG